MAFEGETYDDYNGSREKKSSGGCLKVFLIFTGVAFLLFVAAGVALFFVAKNWAAENFEVTEDPARAAEIGAEIADLDAFAPAALEPSGGMKLNAFGLFEMRLVAFGTAEGGMEEAPLLLGRISGQSVTQDPDAAFAQVRAKIEEMRAKAEVVVKNSETRVVETPDGPVEVTFAEGERAETGEQVKQVTAAVRGDDAVSVMFLSLPAEEYDEAVVLEALKTLDFVGVEPGEAATEAGSAE